MIIDLSASMTQSLNHIPTFFQRSLSNLTKGTRGRSIRGQLMSIALLTPTLFAPLAVADTLAASASAAGQMETITVTASRTGLTIADTASAVTVFDAQDLARRNASSIADLLREIPGVAVSQQGALGGLTQVRMRGAEANQVLVLIDGVEANDVAQGSEFNFAHLDSRHIQRLEVVRGPQSALWGSDALAGVIHIITLPDAGKEPSSKLGANVEFGSLGTQSAGLSYRQQGPQHRLTVSLNDVSVDGSNIARTGSERDGYENTTANLAGSFTTQQNITLDWALRRTESESDFDATDFAVTGLPTDADYFSESEQTYGKLAISVPFFNEHLIQHASWSRSDTDNSTFSGSRVRDTSAGTRDRLLLQTDLLLDAHIVSALVEYEEEDYSQRGTASFFGDPNRDLNTDNTAVAGEYRYDGEAVDLSVSLRHDNNADFDDAVSWRTTAAWHITPDTTVFSSVGEATKNPTFTERFGFFDTFIGNPDLKPEQAQSWELGMRHQLAAANIAIAGSWFHSTLTDEINGFVFDAATGGFTAANSQDESDRDGVELEMDWRISDAASMSMSYTYLDSVAASNGVSQDEVRRPRHQAALNGNYAWNSTNLNLTVAYNGSQFDTFFPPFPPFQEQVELSSFTLVNLAAQHQLNDQVQLTARVDNLLDNDYEAVFGYVAPGRTARLGLRLSF